MNGYASVGRAYTEAAVTTATPERLVVMLFEGALRFLARSSAALRRDEQPLAAENLRRAVAIVDELNHSLDMSYGEIPERLHAIYSFCKRQLIEAGIARDPDTIDGIADLLRELHGAFDEVADRRVPLAQ
jgi:flagellar protein FliS